MSQTVVVINSTVENQKNGVHNKIRGAWAHKFRNETGVQVYFTFGDPLYQFGRNFLQLERDEHILATPDDKTLNKIRVASRWILSKMFTHAIFVTPQTALNPSIMKTGFERYDYSGYSELGDISNGATFQYVDPKTSDFYQAAYPWVDARYGIILSREAMGVVENEIPKTVNPVPDFTIGQWLGPEIFRAHLTAASLDIKDTHSVYSA